MIAGPESRVPVRVRPDQPRNPQPGPGRGCTPGRARPAAGWSSRSTARPSAGPRARKVRPRTWSRRWPTAQARSSGRSGVDAKSNEIPAVRDLLKTFADLAGAVLIRCHAYAKRHRAGHPRPARRLRDDLQGQHAALYKQLKELPGKTIAAVWSVSTGHGRRARRHHQGRAGPVLDRIRRCRPGRAAAPHGHQEGQEDRRGRLPDHQRPRRRPGRTGSLGPRAPGGGKPSCLGTRRHPARKTSPWSGPGTRPA